MSDTKNSSNTPLSSLCDLETMPTDCTVRETSVSSSAAVVSIADWLSHKKRKKEEKMERTAQHIARIELLRLQKVRELRKSYESLCSDLIGIEPPRESFNRWLFERRLEHDIPDPLVPPHRSDRPVSIALHHEILESIPHRVYLDQKVVGKAFRDLRQFVDSCHKLVDKHVGKLVSGDDAARFKREIDGAKRWLNNRRQRRSLRELLDYTRTLKERVGDPLRVSLQHLADEVCSKLSQLSQEKLDQLMEEIEQIQKSPVTHQVQVVQSAGEVQLIFEESVCRTTALHFQKLFELYKIHESSASVDHKDRAYDATVEQDFNERVFALLQRYDTFFGDGKYEGTGFQAALPSAAFRILTREFGVTAECFASPLNCHYAHFCSAFEDTDAPFGSLGSFFEFLPIQGCFEANPPFTIEVMDEMVTHMDMLLSQSDDPLSFIVFVPSWTDAPPLERMDRLQWLTHRLEVEAQEHSYVDGGQHKVESTRREYAAAHATTVYFLQNKAGHKKWPPGAAKIEMLKQAFKMVESG